MDLKHRGEVSPLLASWRAHHITTLTHLPPHTPLTTGHTPSPQLQLELTDAAGGRHGNHKSPAGDSVSTRDQKCSSDSGNVDSATPRTSGKCRGQTNKQKDDLKVERLSFTPATSSDAKPVATRSVGQDQRGPLVTKQATPDAKPAPLAATRSVGQDQRGPLVTKQATPDAKPAPLAATKSVGQDQRGPLVTKQVTPDAKQAPLAATKSVGQDQRGPLVTKQETKQAPLAATRSVGQAQKGPLVTKQYTKPAPLAATKSVGQDQKGPLVTKQRPTATTIPTPRPPLSTTKHHSESTTTTTSRQSETESESAVSVSEGGSSTPTAGVAEETLSAEVARRKRQELQRLQKERWQRKHRGKRGSEDDVGSGEEEVGGAVGGASAECDDLISVGM